MTVSDSIKLVMAVFAAFNRVRNARISAFSWTTYRATTRPPIDETSVDYVCIGEMPSIGTEFGHMTRFI